MTPLIYVSSTESFQFKAIGQSSQLPEHYGADAFWMVGATRWGVQRKTVTDLLASVDDGRLAKELGQMGSLDHAHVVIEGRPQWSATGTMMGSWSEVSRQSWRGMLWSIQSRGATVEFTDNLPETVELVGMLAAWSSKESHSGMRGRPKPRTNPWGSVENREWAIHLLTSIDGIGHTTAGAIYDHFGFVPVSWSVTKEDLMGVDGIGPKKATMLVKTMSGKGE